MQRSRGALFSAASANGTKEPEGFASGLLLDPHRFNALNRIGVGSNPVTGERSLSDGTVLRFVENL
jgi:hypothetical protein